MREELLLALTAPDALNIQRSELIDVLCGAVRHWLPEEAQKLSAIPAKQVDEAIDGLSDVLCKMAYSGQGYIEIVDVEESWCESRSPRGLSVQAYDIRDASSVRKAHDSTRLNVCCQELMSAVYAACAVDVMNSSHVFAARIAIDFLCIQIVRLAVIECESPTVLESVQVYFGPKIYPRIKITDGDKVELSRENALEYFVHRGLLCELMVVQEYVSPSLAAPQTLEVFVNIERILEMMGAMRCQYSLFQSRNEVLSKLSEMVDSHPVSALTFCAEATDEHYQFRWRYALECDVTCPESAEFCDYDPEMCFSIDWIDMLSQIMAKSESYILRQVYVLDRIVIAFIQWIVVRESTNNFLPGVSCVCFGYGFGEVSLIAHRDTDVFHPVWDDPFPHLDL